MCNYFYKNYFTKWKKNLLVTSSISIFCLIYIYINNQKDLVLFEYGSIDKRPDENLITCDLINKNNIQYSVYINNAKYPKFV